MARKTQTPATRVSLGDRFPELRLTAITGETVPIPDTAAHLTHLQFRRFAGCPICNLHLHSITARIDEISAAGIREVVVFHSTATELRKYQGDMPFPVIGDPRQDAVPPLWRGGLRQGSTQSARLAGPSSRLGPRHRQ